MNNVRAGINDVVTWRDPESGREGSGILLDYQDNGDLVIGILIPEMTSGPVTTATVKRAWVTGVQTRA